MSLKPNAIIQLFQGKLLDFKQFVSALHNFIVQMYVNLRKTKSNTNAAGYMYITPRTLLAIIRLSQALARLNFRNEVTINDVHESMRLMEASRSSIVDTEAESIG